MCVNVCVYMYLSITSQLIHTLFNFGEILHSMDFAEKAYNIINATIVFFAP